VEAEVRIVSIDLREIAFMELTLGMAKWHTLAGEAAVALGSRARCAGSRCVKSST
jgi:hypothetical protein